MMAVSRQSRRTERSQLILGCTATLLLWFWVGASSAQAQVNPVDVRVPDRTAWVGQRVPFFVELRANGAFVGTASFDLPQIPGAIIIKMGSPAVSSEEIDGTTWFVQTHEFALFSQRAEKLTIPEFAVRFAHREGFVGDANDDQGVVPEFAIKIQRPPGTENIGFLVTTKSIELNEDWDPQPGPATVGDIFKRTITQQAAQLSGIALAPVSTQVPDGVRVYHSDAEIQDQVERGDLVGNRSETVTYLFAKSGLITLPAMTYVWWNPESETVQSKTLPAARFDVSPPPVKSPLETPVASRKNLLTQIGGWLAAAFAMVMAALQRHRIAIRFRAVWNRLNPPDRVAARELIQACRRNDAVAAERAWTVWRNIGPFEFQPSAELRNSILELERHLFSHHPEGTWQGDPLGRTFRNQLAAQRKTQWASTTRTLNSLNP